MRTAVRLNADIWVKALLRRCEVMGGNGVVVRHGDDSGAILVKLNLLNGTSTVFSPARNGEGELIWLRATGTAPVPEADAEAYIERQRRVDPDIWVVEIEDRHGRHFLLEPVA